MAYVLAYFESIRADLQLVRGTGKLRKPIDPVKHPSFIYRLPNPTTAAAATAFEPLNRGLSQLKPEHFYGLCCQLIVWAPQHYFNHLGKAAAVPCPLCGRPAHSNGWGTHLRRICALGGVYFLIGTRHICKNCPGKDCSCLACSCLAA